ncbi:glutamine--fructose-6-phosphate transaminase (isomerizing) [Candidatus Microgenomates bacterium]|nr:glutamine--fructose-6-phosphate transaminase (isomerizing) [Candidatus Microgenomates bacterium]
MCGIFGYIGPKNAPEVVLEGLKRLEYRGYDSWGIAVVADQIKLNKKVGAIGDLSRTTLPGSTIGIGHTRWATHGGITETNAHPHLSSDKSFALAQNGIVENYAQLKGDLIKKGYKFQTETDTEVIVRLIEEKLSLQPRRLHRNLVKAARAAFLDLLGRNTVIILTRDNQLLAARNGSPLVVGVNRDEVFFSSDTLSFAPFVDKALVVDNGQMVATENGKISLLDIKSGRELVPRLENIDFESSKVDKEGYEHFMLKEIHESPYALNQVINQVDENANTYKKFIKNIKVAKNVYTIGSGTTGIAAAQIAFYLRTFGGIRAVGLTGAEAREYFDLFSKDDLVIAPSQSGETADVLEVLEVLKEKKVKIASYVNMPGSTMTRLSDYKFLIQAGPEICVMATKVFTSKLAWGYLLSKMVTDKKKEGQENLKNLTEEIDKYLNKSNNHKSIKALAKKLAKKQHIFLLGKYQNFNIMREGMVKIIEGSYIHAHAMPAGDLKHYAITLMEKGVPVIVAVSEDVAKDDVLNAVNQVKVRGAEVIGISSKPYEKFDYHIQVPDTGETTAIMNIIPLQLLAYYMAVELGHNVDKPRNIAKSVTVK